MRLIGVTFCCALLLSSLGWFPLLSFPGVLAQEGTAEAAASDEQAAPEPNSESKDIKAQTDGQPAAASPQPHKVQMRLSGSMCMSCLAELKKKLNSLSGVSKVKIDYLGVYQTYGVPGAGFAFATIVYDAGKVNVDAMKSLLRSQGYHPFKVVDKPGR